MDMCRILKELLASRLTQRRNLVFGHHQAPGSIRVLFNQSVSRYCYRSGAPNSVLSILSPKISLNISITVFRMHAKWLYSYSFSIANQKSSSHGKTNRDATPKCNYIKIKCLCTYYNFTQLFYIYFDQFMQAQLIAVIPRKSLA